MKKLIILPVMVLALAFVFAPAQSQQDMLYVPTEAYGGKLQRPPVPFNHDEHNEKAGLDDCAVCHHVFENGQLVEDDHSIGVPCVECHPVSGKTEGGPNLTAAYHKQCGDCHDQANKGPVACGECHVK